MATLNDYFHSEARDFLRTVERVLQRKPAPDAAELHRAVRGLRGTAQMAREQRVFEAASAFESVTRALVGGALAWSDDLTGRARATLDDLRTLLDGSGDDEHLDSLVAEASRRWQEAGTAPVVPTPAAPGAGAREFREFAAREAAAIADELDRGVLELQADPMDREPLKAILRRQRALLGAARLEEIPIIAEILRAVEDLTRVIAKLDIGVKREWLDIYRVARDGLQSTIAPLLRNELPVPTHAVSRLRHMHEELLERYGGDVAAQARAGSFADPAVPVPTAPFVARASTERATAPPPTAPAATPAPPPTAPAAAPVRPAASSAAPPSAAPAGTPVRPAESTAAPPSAAPATAPMPPAMSSASPPVAPPATTTVPAHAVPREEQSAGDVLELEESSVIGATEPPAGAGVPVADAHGADTIEIDTLSYTREDALRRALELYDTIARGAAHDPQLREVVDELFDLIRIALG